MKSDRTSNLLLAASHINTPFCVLPFISKPTVTSDDKAPPPVTGAVTFTLTNVPLVPTLPLIPLVPDEPLDPEVPEEPDNELPP